jgi:hypothetical protein
MLSHVSDRVAETEALTQPVSLPVGHRGTTLVSASAA